MRGDERFEEIERAIACCRAVAPLADQGRVERGLWIGIGHRAEIAYPVPMGKAFQTLGRATGRSIGQAVRGVVEFALPPVCPITGDRVAEHGTLSPDAWADLSFITRPLCAVTGVPFERDVGTGAISAAASARMPTYDRARAAMLYDGTARRLVHQLKYSDRMDLAGLMARWMVIAGRELLDGADLLVPVPLHRRRLIWRRFNQAAALANAVSRQTTVPADVMLLERSKPTQSQVGLSRAGRRRNVRGAFRLSSAAAGERSVAGKHVVLIDDVLTSGATVEACAAVLRRAGAAQVDVLTLARVVAPQDATI